MSLADLVAARQARSAQAAAAAAQAVDRGATQPERVDVSKPAPSTPHAVTLPRSRPRDPLAAVKRKVHGALLEALGPALQSAKLSEDDVAQQVKGLLQEVIDAEETPLTAGERARLTSMIIDEVLGHGPLEPLLRDPDVTEIMVNGPDRIFVERKGRIHTVDAVFADEAHLRRVIDKIVSRVGRRVDEASPLVDARLPDGSRVNVVIPPVSLDGSTMSIRKFATDPFGVDDLIAFGTMTPAVAELLDACVRARLNVLISGGTGSGKTTTLNVLSSFVPNDQRIVTIEDAAELQLRQEHVIRLESRPPNIEGKGQITIRDLVRNALRMRPDRIIVGEVRDGAALDMLQAMNTGHDGSITTLHSNSPRDSLARIETMVLMAGVDLPTRAIREQTASAIDLIVHQSRLRDGTRRITHITEVTGMETDVITLQDIFTFDFGAGVDDDGKYRGTLKATGLRPQFAEKLRDEGIDLPGGLFGGDLR
ncbi:MAG: CpaF family protein [Jatrophihabitans sp.]|uniref:CpaF family protein n=1 Tax=Jatrophihabitans sp. TaxID=1932789 RepID=UPI003F7CE41B